MKGAARRSPTTKSAGSPPTRQSSTRSSGSRGQSVGPAEDQIDDRARRSRLSGPPPLDPDGGIKMRLRRLAVDRGVEAGPLIEEWRCRAWAMQCAEVPDAAERAFQHVTERLCR